MGKAKVRCSLDVCGTTEVVPCYTALGWRECYPRSQHQGPGAPGTTEVVPCYTAQGWRECYPRSQHQGSPPHEAKIASRGPRPGAPLFVGERKEGNGKSNRRSFAHHPRAEKRSGPLSLRMTLLFFVGELRRENGRECCPTLATKTKTSQEWGTRELWESW
jgi:hypothetical protein